MCAVRSPSLIAPRLSFTFVVERSSITQGKGIIHAEMPVHAPGVPEPRGLQLWVDLPKQVRSCEDGCIRTSLILQSADELCGNVCFFTVQDGGKLTRRHYYDVAPE